MNISLPNQRTHVTLAYDGLDDLPLPKLGKQKFTLKPGNNTLPLSYFHALGLDPTISRLLGSGKLRAVCEEHVFEDGEGEKNEGKPDNASHCRDCGHSRTSAGESK